jgi:hypothetical protein
VPQGNTYTVFIVTEGGFFWEDDWLTVPTDEALDLVELGDLVVSLE